MSKRTNAGLMENGGEAMDKSIGVKLRITWARDEQEFWLHVHSSDGVGAGFNLGGPNNMIGAACLRAAVGTDFAEHTIFNNATPLGLLFRENPALHRELMEWDGEVVFWDWPQGKWCEGTVHWLQNNVYRAVKP